jgi:hypothetical protein
MLNLEELLSESNLLIKSEEKFFVENVQSFIDQVDVLIAKLEEDNLKSLDDLAIANLKLIDQNHKEIAARVEYLYSQKPEQHDKFQKLVKGLRAYNNKLPAKINFFAKRQG